MRAGTLRHRVAIQTAVDTQDATTGEPVRSWSTLATVWADVSPIKGRELALGGVDLSEMDTRVRIRFASALADLGTKSRLALLSVDGRIDRLYDVVSVAESRLGRREIELMCKSGTNEG